MRIAFKNKINKRLVLVGIALVTIASILFYLKMKYQYVGSKIESLRIVLSRPIPSNTFVVYISDSTEVSINFKTAFFPQAKNDSIQLINLGRKNKLRQFRLYFQRPIENVTIKGVSLLSDDYEHKLDLRRLGSELIQVIATDKDALSFEVLSNRGDAYVESPQFYYPEDYGLLLISILVAIVFAYLLFLFLANVDSEINLNALSIQELGVIAFIFSIFLPQVFFNVTLVTSILLVIKEFKFDYFVSSRLNLLLVLFYFIIFLSFLVFTPTYNFRLIEKYTPFLVLPIYVSCIRGNKLLIFFCVSAFLIGGCLLVGALINISIFRNLEVVSFDNFTGVLHPVYFSYLLAFSILYIEIGTSLRHKYWIHLALVLLLILCGSKIILLALLFGLTLFLKKSISIVAILILLIAFFTFAPLRDRIVSVLNLHDLSIVIEEHIDNPDDARLNGFTFRVILWQESLRMNSVKELIFGRGVGSTSNDALERSLEKRGLTNHLWYNAHNQYVTTLDKTGLLGLGVLIGILFYCLRNGMRTKNRILVLFTLLMAWALLSESVFERVSGIVFFGMVILLLTKSEIADVSKQNKMY